MTDAEKIELAERAQRLLNDDFLTAVFTKTEKEAVEALLTCDEAERIEHIALIRAIRNLRSNLQSIVTTGKNAANRAQ